MEHKSAMAKRGTMTPKMARETKNGFDLKTAEGLRNRTKGDARKARRAVNRDTILTLTESLNTKPKFAKMVEYSVECLRNLAVDEASVDEMCEEGVVEALLKVLKCNPYDEKIQRMVNEALLIFSKSDKLAQTIAKKLGAGPLVHSMKRHVEPETLASTAETTARLLRLGGKENIDMFIHAGAAGSIGSVIKNGEGNTKVLGPAFEVVEHLTRHGDHMMAAELVENGTVDGLLQALQDHPEDERVVKHAIAAIANLAKISPEARKALKEKGAVDILATALEYHPDNEEILELGRMAFVQLVDPSDLEAAMQVDMNDPAAAAKALGKLASLLLVPENVDYLIKNNGLPWLMAALKGAIGKDDPVSKNILRAGTRALGRMANNEKNIYDIMSQGGVKALVAILENHGDDENIAASALRALGNMATRKENAKYMSSKGVVEASQKVMKKHPNSTAVGAAGQELFARMAAFPEMAPELVEKGVIEETVRTMQEHMDHEPIVKSSLETLGRLALSPDNVQRIVRAGGVEAMSLALQEHKESPDLVKTNMLLMETIAMDPSSVQALRQAGAVEAILEGLDANPENAEIQDIGTRVLAKVAGPQELQKIVNQVRADASEVSRAPRKPENVNALAKDTRILNALSAPEQNVAPLVKFGGVDAFLDAIKAGDKLPMDDLRRGIQSDASAGLARLARAEPATADAIVERSGVQQLLGSTLKDSGNETLAENGTEVAKFSLMGHNRDNVGRIVNQNGVEDLVAVAKMHPLNETVQRNVAQALQAMAAVDPSTISRMAAAGAPDVLLESLYGNMNDPTKLGEAMSAIEALTADPAMAQGFIDAGGVDAILQAMRRHPDKPEILKGGMSALDNMQRVDKGVRKEIGDKEGVPILVKAMRDHYKDGELIGKDVKLCKNMAKEESNKEKFLKPKLTAVDLIKWVQKKYKKSPVVVQDAEKLLELLVGPKIVKAPAVGGKLTDAQVEAILRSIADPTVDKAELKRMLQELEAAMHDPANAQLFAEKGGLEALMALMKRSQNDEEIFYPASKAFLTLMENGGLNMDDLLDNPLVLESLTNILSANQRFATPIDIKDLTRASNMLAKNRLKPATVKQLSSQAALGSLLNILATSDDPDLLAQAGKLLGKLSNDEATLKLLGQMASIRELINAMRRNINNTEFLMYGAYLLGNFASVDALKEEIGLEGGIVLLLQIIQKYPENKDLVENCCYALANLSYNHSNNNAFITAGKGIPTLIAVMGQHPNAESLLESAIIILTNVCQDSDRNPEEIIKIDGARAIVETVTNNFEALDLVVATFRCIGTMAMVRRIIPKIVEAGAIQALVAGMTVHASEPDILMTAVKVIAALSFDSTPQTMKMMAEEGAVQAVVEVTASYADNLALESAAMRALFNLASEADNASMIIRQGGVQSTLEACKVQNYEAKLAEQVMRLLLRLTGTRREVDIKQMVDAGAGEGFVAAAKACPSVKPVIGAGLNMITGLCLSSELAKEVADQDVAQIALVLLKKCMDDPTLVPAVLKALGGLSRDKETAMKLSGMALGQATEVFQRHNQNKPVVATALMFLANLCFHKECAEKIRDCTILDAVLVILDTHKTEAPILIRGCKALHNMALAQGNQEFMKKAAVLQAMKQIQANNLGKEDIRGEAQRVIDVLERMDIPDLTFTDMRPRNDKKKTAAEIFGREEKRIVKKLPTDIRNFLQQGALLNKHSKSAKPRPRHVFVDNELKFLIWKDPKEKLLDPRNKMKIYKIKQIEEGRSTPQLQRKSFGKYLAKEECSFAVVGQERTVDLEASDEASRKQWVNALEILVEWHRANKKAKALV
eukprot:gb/GEZN01000208.1/.p1 GENE.gb/GEZN01000208.1/~~gb/GEZN01000208.1/.p1  ORF type:complete len:1820 (-),score=317.02 gb/GEZN01000208.1/:164-5623(-)